MNEPEFENKLRGLRPASPSRSLEGRIASALPKPKAPHFSWAAWLGERLIWTAGGAAAAWLLFMQFVPSHIQSETKSASQVAAAPRVSEEPAAWADAGVQLIGGKTPARLIHRQVIERHQSADGRSVVQVPREDVILVPVALH
ncbi:MAG: hypothetical protein WCN98_11995 [Verrucomicrobiaceae bacterium]